MWGRDVLTTHKLCTAKAFSLCFLKCRDSFHWQVGGAHPAPHHYSPLPWPQNSLSASLCECAREHSVPSRVALPIDLSRISEEPPVLINPVQVSFPEMRRCIQASFPWASPGSFWQGLCIFLRLTLARGCGFLSEFWAFFCHISVKSAFVTGQLCGVMALENARAAALPGGRYDFPRDRVLETGVEICGETPAEHDPGRRILLCSRLLLEVLCCIF